MVNTRRQRVRIFHIEVDRSAADPAHRLRCIYFLLSPLECKPMGAIFVGSVSLPLHNTTPKLAGGPVYFRASRIIFMAE